MCCVQIVLVLVSHSIDFANNIFDRVDIYILSCKRERAPGKYEFCKCPTQVGNRAEMSERKLKSILEYFPSRNTCSSEMYLLMSYIT